MRDERHGHSRAGPARPLGLHHGLEAAVRVVQRALLDKLAASLGP